MPILRPVTLTLGTDRSVADVQQRSVDARLWQSCVNCEHREMRGETLHCSLFKATPPITVIVVGCGEWGDDIPF